MRPLPVSLKSALIALTCALLLSPITLAQPGEKGGQETEKKDESKKKKKGPKPYDKVITKGATTQSGLFQVHRIDDKVMYEIPRSSFGEELLWVTQVAQTQSGFGYGGTAVGNRVVRWELRDEEVLLRDVKHRIRAGADDAVNRAVKATSLEPIIASFPVKAWGKDQAAVIDVTSLFMDDLPEFSAKRRMQASGVDKKRSSIEKVRAFPTNIEAKVMMTYKLSSTPRAGGRGRGSRRDPSQSAVTVMLHHSMVELPKNPMQPRRHDERVGFFTVAFEEYASDEHEVERVRYITRWRLEKKDPKAEVSEPKKPIVFHVGRGVPERWKPYVRKGIEMWKPAFEAAGFKNAIIAKNAPSEREDPTWDAEDARWSTIRWLPSTTENAMGPHVNDPRTGEILEADIIMYHNVIKLCRDWYFIQASPNDKRAQTLPLPDDLLGELLAYVVAHEVGHSLGFPHNMKASNSYTVEQLRDPEFTKKYGTEASIMDYGRFNYVAQPGDGAALIPKIGPYDMFAIDWGYRQFNDRAEEIAGLARRTALQLQDVKLRFGGPNSSEDPSQQTEDLGSDAIEATRLGLKNLERVASYIVKATCKPGKDYKLLRNMYDELFSQRNRELGHVANLVGGMKEANLWYGDADRRFSPVSKERQKQAIAFLNEQAFKTPLVLLDQDIVWRLESSGAADRVLNGQKRLLRTLISNKRVKRMSEHAAMAPEEAYSVHEMLGDISSGIWGELNEPDVSIDLYRRNLQRAHVETLAGEVKKKDASSDLPALSRSTLETLSQSVKAAKSKDPVTSSHLKDILNRIREALGNEKGNKDGPNAF